MSPIAKMPGREVAQVAGIDPDVVVLEVEPPGGERPEIGRQTEERQQAIGLEPARVAGEVGDDDRRELAAGAFERVQLVGDRQLDPARRRRAAAAAPPIAARRGTWRGGARP